MFKSPYVACVERISMFKSSYVACVECIFTKFAFARVYLQDLEEVFARYKPVLVEYSDCQV